MVTLPKSLVLAKGWKQGDLLEFTLDSKGEIVIKKVKDAKKANVIVMEGEDES